LYKLGRVAPPTTGCWRASANARCAPATPSSPTNRTGPP